MGGDDHLVNEADFTRSYRIRFNEDPERVADELKRLTEHPDILNEAGNGPKGGNHGGGGSPGGGAGLPAEKLQESLITAKSINLDLPLIKAPSGVIQLDLTRGKNTDAVDPKGKCFCGKERCEGCDEYKRAKSTVPEAQELS